MKNIILIITIIMAYVPNHMFAQEDFLSEIRVFSGEIPDGWMACDGQEMSISDYSTLYTLLGTTYGGDGRQSFNLPNLNDKLAVGEGNGFLQGKSGGSNEITLKKENLPDLHGSTWDFDPSEELKPPTGRYYNQITNIGVGSEPNNTIRVEGTGLASPLYIRQPSLSLRYAICVEGLYMGDSDMSGMVGEMRMVACAPARIPSGWKICNGDLLQTSEYQMAYSILNTSFGGDGRTTFGLPDLSGRVPIGAGKGPGRPQILLGSEGGEQSIELLGKNLPLETVPVAFMAITTTKDKKQVVEIKKFGPGNKSLLAVGNKPTGAFDFKTSHTPISLVQPYSVINYIICLEGNYPSR